MHSGAAFDNLMSQPGYRDARCVHCKGSRNMCGKDRCPILVRYHARLKTAPMIDSLTLDGSSPPGVFIGRWGYPKVLVGPLIPPQHGDTTMLDTPEQWSGMPIESIVDFRASLVRGMYPVNVKNFENGGRIVELTQEMGMASGPSEAEAWFEKKPFGAVRMDEEVQPFGPSAPLKRLDVGTLKIDQRIDRAFGDTDLKSVDAVRDLYKNGLIVSRIQKAFSVGAFGIKRNRKMVPTRWSITAVDDILGKGLLQKTKTYPTINDFRAYDFDALDNRWCVVLLPTSWRYELIEAWYPNSVWNPFGRDVEIMSSHEFFDGRSTYAEIGGCYYAARLAVNELLERERRQAGAVILREAHAGYIMPVGVWNVRENVRNALETKPSTFPSLRELMDHVSKRMAIPLKRWMNHSAVLSDFVYQKRIDDFLEVKDDRLERLPRGS